MKRILKYPLKLQDWQEVKMPYGAEMLAVQAQGNTLCLWALVDEAREKAVMSVRIFGTGNPADDAWAAEYVGTVQMDGFVWHVFVKDTHRLDGGTDE